MDSIVEMLGGLAVRLADLDSRHASSLYAARDKLSADPEDEEDSPGELPVPGPGATPEEWEAWYKQENAAHRMFGRPSFHTTQERLVEPKGAPPPVQKDEEAEGKAMAQRLIEEYQKSLPKPVKKTRWDASLDQLAQQLHTLNALEHSASICEIRDVLAAPRKKKVEAPPEPSALGEKDLFTQMLDTYKETLKTFEKKPTVKGPSTPSSQPSEEAEGVRKKTLATFLDRTAECLGSLGSEHAAALCALRDEVSVKVSRTDPKWADFLDAIGRDLGALGSAHTASVCALRDALTPQSLEVELRSVKGGAIIQKITSRTASMPIDWVEGAFLTADEVAQIV